MSQDGSLNPLRYESVPEKGYISSSGSSKIANPATLYVSMAFLPGSHASAHIVVQWALLFCLYNINPFSV